MKTIKVRIYPTNEQLITLAKHFGCTRWLSRW
ncbi:helix-turn-helix domain-containing protein [Synechococcus sp. Nb3U1]